MLGAIAAVALVVGSISATAVVNKDQHPVAEDNREPVVEVLTIESQSATEENRVF